MSLEDNLAEVGDDLARVRADIDAVEYLLSQGIKGDPNNPNIAMYQENFEKVQLKDIYKQLRDEKKLLIVQKNIWLQQQTGNVFLCEFLFDLKYVIHGLNICSST